jgi:hypothetical protein
LDFSKGILGEWQQHWQQFAEFSGLLGFKSNGGEAGIRTLGTGFGPYNGLANRRLQPLGHLSAA